MNCSEVQKQLSIFIDGELEATQCTAIKAHLMRCNECRRERDQLDRVGSTLRKLPPVTAPFDFEYRVFAGIRNTQLDQKAPKILWLRPAVPIAAMVVGIFIGAMMLQPLQQSLHVATTDAPVNSVADYIGMSPVLADDSGIVEYTIDSYIPNTMVPITVDYIPPDGDSTDINSSYRGSSSSRTAPETNEKYVLDRIPLRVSYERSIY